MSEGRAAEDVAAVWVPIGALAPWPGNPRLNGQAVDQVAESIKRFGFGEPLLGPLPSLDLAGIAWLIVGGESGKGFRPMDHAWARELLTKARAAGTAFFFKQSAAAVTERGLELDGRRYEEYPALARG